MEKYNAYIKFDKEVARPLLTENTFLDMYDDVCTKAYDGSSLFFNAFQSFFVRISLIINKGLSEPKYTDINKNSKELDGNFSKLVKFICLKVLKNESLNYEITCEKVNPKANSLKHTIQNVCGDINAVVVIYNQIIDSLIEKLEFEELNNYKINLSGNWQWQSDDWDEKIENAIISENNYVFPQIQYENALMDELIGNGSLDVDELWKNDLMLYFLAKPNVVEKEEISKDKLIKDKFFGISDIKLLLIPSYKFISRYGNCKIELYLENKNGVNCIKEGKNYKSFSAKIENAILFDLSSITTLTNLKFEEELFVNIVLKIVDEENVVVDSVITTVVYTKEKWEVV